MDYSQLDEETKTFFNTAIDIYSIIENREIAIKDRWKEQNRATKLDKRILSLLIAGLIVEGDLKEIISNYDEIKLIDLLNFVGISIKDIEGSTKKGYDYPTKYRNLFEMEIRGFIKKYRDSNRRAIYKITPTIIVELFQGEFVTRSQILDFYARSCKMGNDSLYSFKYHPIFPTLEQFNTQKGYAATKKKPVSKQVFGDRGEQEEEVIGGEDEEDPEFENPLPFHQKDGFVEIEDRVWVSLDTIKERFIGQEEVAEGLFYNVVNNQVLAETGNTADGQRAIIFLDGPSGTGKTAINKAIAKEFGIPAVVTAITSYSETGYIGGDLTDILVNLYKAAKGNLELAQRGIVILDEFDKLANLANFDGNGMRLQVQHELLDFLGGGILRNKNWRHTI